MNYNGLMEDLEETQMKKKKAIWQISSLRGAEAITRNNKGEVVFSHVWFASSDNYAITLAYAVIFVPIF